MTPVKYESDSKNIAVFLQNKKILHGKNNKRGFSNPHPGLAGFRDPFLNLRELSFRLNLSTVKCFSGGIICAFVNL